MREKTEAEGVVEMFKYMYDNYKECGYETLKDAIMAESNRVIAVELAKLNDRFAEASAYNAGFCEWAREAFEQK